MIGATSAVDSDVEIDLNDILESRRFALMGAVAVNKGRWTLSADMIYLKVDGSSEITPGLNASAEVTSWVITPMVGYNLFDTGKGRLDLLGGARYLSVKAKLDVDELGAHADGSESNLDAIIGYEEIKANYCMYFLGNLEYLLTSKMKISNKAQGR
jgi:hypothetical protein